VLRLRRKPSHEIFHYGRLEIAEVLLRFSSQPLGERGARGDGRRAPPCFIARFRHHAPFHAGREPQDISASWIRCLDGHCGRRQFSHVAWISKMFDQPVAVQWPFTVRFHFRAKSRMHVVAAIIARGESALICQRKAGQQYAGKWEFPGGKVEPGEELKAALARELQEELGIAAVIGELLAQYEYAYPGRAPVHLAFYQVDKFEGEPSNLIFEEIRWEKVEDLPGYDFLDGDVAFVKDYATRRRNFS